MTRISDDRRADRGQRVASRRHHGIVALAAIAGLTAMALAGPARAESLADAMAQAYRGNPQLEAARTRLKATDEQLPQARGGYLPNLTFQATGGHEQTESKLTTTGFNPITGEVSAGGTTTDTTDTNPYSVQLQLAQPIFRGGQTVNAVEGARNTIRAERAALIDTEQQVLLDVTTAYMDVVRDRAVVELNRNNVRVLDRQLAAARDRFEVGDVTRTDVEQARARLSRAQADLIAARGSLRETEARYERVVGTRPGDLIPPEPGQPLPESLEETIELARSNNPALIQADFTEKAARADADRVTGELLPELNVIGTLSRRWNPSETVDRVDTARVEARLDVPLYQQGAVSARVRAAKQTANQRRLEIDDVRRQVTESAIQAWENLLTARAAIIAREDQVESNEVALDGVEQEAKVGARTTLDILDAEQELLNSRVDLVRAQRDRLVAHYQLLSVIGKLNARDLSLPVEYYDFTQYHEAVDGRIWGTSLPE